MNRPSIIDTPDDAAAIRGELPVTHRVYRYDYTNPIRDRVAASKHYAALEKQQRRVERAEAFVAWFKRINYRTPFWMIVASAVLVFGVNVARWAL